MCAEELKLWSSLLYNYSITLLPSPETRFVMSVQFPYIQEIYYSLSALILYYIIFYYIILYYIYRSDISVHILLIWLSTAWQCFNTCRNKRKCCVWPNSLVSLRKNANGWNVSSCLCSRVWPLVCLQSKGASASWTGELEGSHSFASWPWRLLSAIHRPATEQTAVLSQRRSGCCVGESSSYIAPGMQPRTTGYQAGRPRHRTRHRLYT